MLTKILIGFIAYLLISQAVAMTMLLVKWHRVEKAVRAHLEEPEQKALGIGA